MCNIMHIISMKFLHVFKCIDTSFTSCRYVKAFPDKKANLVLVLHADC